VPSRFWIFPRTKARFKVFLETLLDAVDPWSECVVASSVWIRPDGTSALQAKAERIGKVQIPFSLDGGVCSISVSGNCCSAFCSRIGDLTPISRSCPTIEDNQFRSRITT